MVTAELRDGIVFIRITGRLAYDDFLAAVEPILQSGQKYVGFVSDGREMQIFRGVGDQQLLAQHHRTHNADKPNAILVSTSLVLIANVYLMFAKPPNTRVFTSEEEAIAWIRSFGSRDA